MSSTHQSKITLQNINRDQENDALLLKEMSQVYWMKHLLCRQTLCYVNLLAEMEPALHHCLGGISSLQLRLCCRTFFSIQKSIRCLSHTYLNALRLRHFPPEEHAAGRVLNSHVEPEKERAHTGEKSAREQRASSVSFKSHFSFTPQQCSALWKLYDMGEDTKLHQVPKATQLSSVVDSMGEKFEIHRFAFLERMRGKGNIWHQRSDWYRNNNTKKPTTSRARDPARTSLRRLQQSVANTRVQSQLDWFLFRVSKNSAAFRGCLRGEPLRARQSEDS